MKVAYQTAVGGETQIDGPTSNVGIGTNSPQATLDVNGYARLAKQSAPACRLRGIE